jgi:hypothetical protein
MKIAKLNKVELREVWAHEAHEFTKWLAEPENLELLSDEIGIGIELVQVEANVGRYNVDILAREENTSKKSSSKTSLKQPITAILVSSSPTQRDSKLNTLFGSCAKLAKNTSKPLIG